MGFPVRLTVSEWNPGADRKALLVHGLTSVGASWWRVASRLASAGYHVVAPDLRGHGRSPHTETYHLADMASDLLLLGRGWDVAVGHSLGGPIVAAAADPGWARRVVLVDPLLESPDEGLDDLVGRLVTELRADPKAIAAAHPGWHPEDVAIKAQGVAGCSPTVVERCLLDNRPWDHAGLVGRVRAPVTLLGAEHDALLTPELGERLAAGSPSIRYRLVPGTGHSIHRDDPEPVVAAALGA
jgi:pimeloyl-ACP methyl ester carboxylesterase